MIAFISVKNGRLSKIWPLCYAFLWNNSSTSTRNNPDLPLHPASCPYSKYLCGIIVSVAVDVELSYICFASTERNEERI